MKLLGYAAGAVVGFFVLRELLRIDAPRVLTLDERAQIALANETNPVTLRTLALEAYQAGREDLGVKLGQKAARIEGKPL